MVRSTIKEEISRQLESMPPEIQQLVLDFVRSLSTPSPGGVPGAQLLRFGGIMSKEDARTMIQAIDQGCEQVEASGW